MWDWGSVLNLVLAADPPAGKAPPQQDIFQMMFPLFMIVALWYFLIMRPQSRDRKRREELLKQIKKNDPVVTIGGILGTVANISADGNEVTLKVDDNTRIRVRRRSIESVVKEPDKTDGEK